jgi:hypothetical protein
MNEVWVLFGTIDYHGDTVLGVFTTEDAAERHRELLSTALEHQPERQMFDGGFGVLRCALDQLVEWRTP